MVTVAVEHLSVDLGGRRVLHDIGCTFAAGEMIGIVGPNGAGKSTFARAMLGLLPAAEGRVTIDGIEVRRMPPRDRARRIAYLPQGQQLHWPLSVERLVALGRLPHLAPFSRIGASDRAAVEAAMARADVLHLAGRVATELSGGERARVLLARALAVEADALVADEPLAALDPGHQFQVMSLLGAIAADGGLAIAVLHDLTMAARFCNRILLLHEGRLIADGPPSTVLDDRNMATVYGVAAWRGSIGGEALIIPLQRSIDAG